MRYGIMSMQRVYNYGSFLQAYALKRILEETGHEVVFVDYQVEPCIVKNQESALRRYARELKNKILYHNKSNSVQSDNAGSLDFSVHFENEMFPLLGISQKRTEREKVDCLIIGSDEVFNCLQTNKDVGYSRELFGKNHNSRYLLSFAASFGNTTLNGLKEYGIDTEIAGLLKEFNELSVRDKNSFSIVKALTGKEPKLHIDPVFHYNYDKELPDVQIDSPFLAVYAYPYRLKADEIQQIKDFAAKKGLMILCFAGPQHNLGEYKNIAAFEMLAYIKKAKYVITDTFHGTVFSIKYSVPFVSIVRQTMKLGQYGNAEKIMCLLEMMGLEDRALLGGADTLEDTIVQSVHWGDVNSRINNYVEDGLKYLREAGNK